MATELVPEKSGEQYEASFWVGGLEFVLGRIDIDISARAQVKTPEGDITEGWYLPTVQVAISAGKEERQVVLTYQLNEGGVQEAKRCWEEGERGATAYPYVILTKIDDEGELLYGGEAFALIEGLLSSLGINEMVNEDLDAAIDEADTDAKLSRQRETASKPASK